MSSSFPRCANAGRKLIPNQIPNAESTIKELGVVQ
jgi:hypothetical protein